MVIVLAREMRGLRLKSSFLVLPENRVIGFVLLPIRPAELGKTTNTTFTTSNNLRAVARIALLLQGKQQNTTLRHGHFLLIVLAKRCS